MVCACVCACVQTLELLLQLKELRCARLQALINLKEARLKEAKAREATLKSPTTSPTNQAKQSSPSFSGGSPSSATAGSPPPPPPLRRMSTSIVNVEAAELNTAPLGKLQPLGRKEYRPSAATRFGSQTTFANSASAVAAAAAAMASLSNPDAPRGALLPAGVPSKVVERWHAGAISGDLALREVLDAVCRARSGKEATPEERELSAMTHDFSADLSLSLGGPLGGLVGGLPLARLDAASASRSRAADLSPLRALLCQPPEPVCCDALRLFTRQLLTGAEAEAGADRHALTIDLAKLSSEELNLAFRRACLKHHPNRKDGSLGALLCVHLRFALVSLTWHALTPADRAAAAEEATADAERALAEGSLWPADSDATAATDGGGGGGGGASSGKSADSGDIGGGRRAPSTVSGGVSAGGLEAAMLRDAEVLLEVGTNDEVLALQAEKAEGQDPAGLAAYNERMAARAMHMTKIRNLLESQLESMKGAGAYTIIGCDPECTDKQLAAAYRDAARRMHPDRGGDKVQFQRLQAAYEEVTKMRKANGGMRGAKNGGGGSAERAGGRRSKKEAKAARKAEREQARQAAKADGGDAEGGAAKAAAEEGGADPDADDAGEGRRREKKPKKKKGVDDGEAEDEAEEADDEEEGEEKGADKEGGAIEGEDKENEAKNATGKAAEGEEGTAEAEADKDKEKDEEGGEEGEGEEDESERRWREAAERVQAKEDARKAKRAEGGGEDDDDEEEGDPRDGMETDDDDEEEAEAEPAEPGEMEDGEIPHVDARTASAAAEAEARAAARAGMGSDDDEDGLGGGPALSSEEMCNLAEQAAEAARACAASSRIGKRVCELGSGGWGVLCDCAQTVLRTCRAASSTAMRVGHSAMRTPPGVTGALDDATERKLEKGGEREVRALMEAILSAVREGRDAAAKAKECTDKASEGAQVVLSLIRLPPNAERLASAVGSEALAALMLRVAEVLAEMATCVGEAAERAMSTAVSVEAMHRQAGTVKQLAKAAADKAAARGEESSEGSSGSDSDDDEEDEEVRRKTAEAKKKAAEEEARRREEEERKAAEEAENQTNPEANLGPKAKERLANARLLRKLSAEVREAQEKLRSLVSAAPQLMPGVTVAQKEDLFTQLAEVLAAAEQPIARRWYERKPKPGTAAATAAATAVAAATAAATAAAPPPPCAAAASPAKPVAVGSDSEDEDDPAWWSVRRLREFLSSRQVSTLGLSEKREFVAEVRRVQKEEGGGKGAPPPPPPPPAVDPAEAARAAQADAEDAEWVRFVCRRLDFVFHAADPHSLPVPASLSARLLRQAVLVDAELTTQMLRSQLLHRVLLFAPEPLAAPAATPAAAAEARPPRPRLDALTTRLDDALKKLNSLCIATS